MSTALNCIIIAAWVLPSWSPSGCFCSVAHALAAAASTQNVEGNAMDNNPSSAVIAAERAAREQRLCRFIADESADFARKCGVTVNSIKTDVIPLRFDHVADMPSFVASVHVRINEP